MKVLLKPLQWIYCIYAFITFVAIMLLIFPFVIDRQFFWTYQGRQYDDAALYALGRYVVSVDIYLAQKNI